MAAEKTNNAYSLRFPKTARLLTQPEYDRVFKKGRRFYGRHFKAWVADCAGSHGSRLGLRVSKARGNAVLRNRIKRLLREAFRRRRVEWSRDRDVVVVPVGGSWPILKLPEVLEDFIQLERFLAGKRLKTKKKQ